MICKKEILLLIAYGNSLRRDDGAGLALAERLAEDWRTKGVQIRHLAVQQLAPEMVVELSSLDLQSVIFVDTTANAAESIQIKPATPTILGRVLGHHVTPGALLLYVEHLYGQCPPAWLVTIPGVDFGFGEGFSTVAMQHLATAEKVANALLATVGYVPGSDDTENQTMPAGQEIRTLNIPS